MLRYNVKSLDMVAEWGLCEAENANEAAEKCAECLFSNHPRESYNFKVSSPERGISAIIKVFVYPVFYSYDKNS